MSSKVLRTCRKQSPIFTTATRKLQVFFNKLAGQTEWNARRDKDASLLPDLTEAKLIDANLSGA
jgi:hypothetical protein